MAPSEARDPHAGSPGTSGDEAFALWSELESEFLLPRQPWTSLRFIEWDASGSVELAFSSGERDYRRREEHLVDPGMGNDRCLSTSLGQLRIEETRHEEDAVSREAFETRLERAPGAGNRFLIEVASPNAETLHDLGRLLGCFLDPDVAKGIEEFGFRERLVRARSDNHTLPASLERAGVICLDVRVPTVRQRYGNYALNVIVAQRWLRMLFSSNWLVALWSPPVISELSADFHTPQDRPVTWDNIVATHYSTVSSYFPPRSERWRSDGGHAIREPSGTQGGDLAMRYLQDVTVACDLAITGAVEEIALSEHQLFTETIRDESWISCDFDKVQVDLMILGGFLFDLSEDLVMLDARVRGEPSLDKEDCVSLHGVIAPLIANLERPRTQLRDALNTLAALKTTRRINVEDEAGRRNRRLEVLIGVAAAVTLVPGLIFAAFQLPGEKWPAFVLSAVISALVVFLVLRALRNDVPFSSLLDRNDDIWDPHRARLERARSRIQNTEWDDEWPSRRGAR